MRHVTDDLVPGVDSLRSALRDDLSHLQPEWVLCANLIELVVEETVKPRQRVAGQLPFGAARDES